MEGPGFDFLLSVLGGLRLDLDFTDLNIHEDLPVPEIPLCVHKFR